MESIPIRWQANHSTNQPTGQTAPGIAFADRDPERNRTLADACRLRPPETMKRDVLRQRQKKSAAGHITADPSSASPTRGLREHRRTRTR